MSPSAPADPSLSLLVELVTVFSVDAVFVIGDDALADQLSSALSAQRDVITARRQLWAPGKVTEDRGDDSEYIDGLMGDLRGEASGPSAAVAEVVKLTKSTGVVAQDNARVVWVNRQKMLDYFYGGAGRRLLSPYNFSVKVGEECYLLQYNMEGGQVRAPPL